MSLETIHPSSAINGVIGIGAGAQWTTIDIGNGDATKTGSFITAAGFAFAFSDEVESSSIISNTLKFNYTTGTEAGATDIFVYVSYDSGTSWTLLSQLAETNGVATAKTFDLNSSYALSKVQVAFKDAGTDTTTSIDNCRLDVIAIAVDFKIVNDLAQEIIEEMGGRTADGKMIRIVERWIDDVYKKIIAFHNWSWARETSDIDTIADQAVYIVPIAAMHVSGFRKASGEKVNYRSREQLTNQGWDFSQTGTPLFWFSENMSNGAMKVTLTPTPTEEETLTAYGTPRPINLKTDDFIPLPTEFMPVLKDGVRAYYSRNDGHPEDGAMYDQLFGTGLIVLRSRFAKEPDDYSRMSDTDIPNSQQNVMGRWPSNFPQ